MQRCACSGVGAVLLQLCGTSRGRAGLMCCIVCASVLCAMRGWLMCAVLGYMRHDADVQLWWVGLVVSCWYLRACVCGVMVAGSVALVGMCVSCALGLRECEESWLRHTRDVRCASWVCIADAVSSAVSRVLCRSIAIADLRRRVCVAAPRVAGSDVWRRSAACDCFSG